MEAFQIERDRHNLAIHVLLHEFVFNPPHLAAKASQEPVGCQERRHCKDCALNAGTASSLEQGAVLFVHLQDSLCPRNRLVDIHHG